MKPLTEYKYLRVEWSSDRMVVGFCDEAEPPSLNVFYLTLEGSAGPPDVAKRFLVVKPLEGRLKALWVSGDEG